MTEEKGLKRDEKGMLVKGTPPGPGRPKETEEDKTKKKALKEVVDEFIEKHRGNLAEALPKISPVLIEKAVKGDIQAIKEIHDRVMGRPPQTIDSSEKHLHLHQHVTSKEKELAEEYEKQLKELKT